MSAKACEQIQPSAASPAEVSFAELPIPATAPVKPVTTNNNVAVICFIFITGGSGAVENSYLYDAFGNVLESREDIENRILYTSQQYDQETGQYYLKARFYNPVVGRFTQEDTCREDGLNLYAYCANNPVMYYDPSGYAKKCKKSDQAGDEKQKATVFILMVLIRNQMLHM